MPDKTKRQMMIDSFAIGLQGQLRNATHQWRKLWIANGGDDSVILPPDEVTVELTETGVMVDVLPDRVKASTPAAKASKSEPAKKAASGGDS